MGDHLISLNALEEELQNLACCQEALDDLIAERAEIEGVEPPPQPSATEDEQYLLGLLNDYSLSEDFNPVQEELTNLCQKVRRANEAKNKQLLNKQQNLINDILVSYIHNWYVKDVSFNLVS